MIFALLGSCLMAVVSYGVAALLFGITPFPRVGLSWRAKHWSDRHTSWLREAGIPFPAFPFWMGCVAVGGVSFLVLWRITGVWAVALLPAWSAAAFPVHWFRHAHMRCEDARREAWPDALADVVSSLQSGRTMHDSLAELSVSGPVALRPALTRYGELQFTHGQTVALEIVRQELADPISDLVIEVFSLAMGRGTGEALFILRDVGEKIADELDNRRQIRSDALEHRIETTAVVVIPWFILTFLVMSHGDIRAFYRTESGLIVLGVCVFILETGRRVVGYLGRVPPDPRVFRGKGGLLTTPSFMADERIKGGQG